MTCHTTGNVVLEGKEEEDFFRRIWLHLNFCNSGASCPALKMDTSPGLKRSLLTEHMYGVWLIFLLVVFTLSRGTSTSRAFAHPSIAV